MSPLGSGLLFIFRAMPRSLREDPPGPESQTLNLGLESSELNDHWSPVLARQP